MYFAHLLCVKSAILSSHALTYHFGILIQKHCWPRLHSWYRMSTGCLNMELELGAIAQHKLKLTNEVDSSLIPSR